MTTTTTTFDYLLDKISTAEISTVPFSHLEISDFLSGEHFDEVVCERQIALDGVSTTENLLGSLDSNGYEIIPFPGCVTSKQAYLDWFHGRSEHSVHDATEGFGIVYRLTRYDSPILNELNAFFVSDQLKDLLLQKFDITAQVQVDAGIQKYLTGYEISPHPDVRRKALTWMLNINPGDVSQETNFHTHYMRLKDKWRFIGEFWRYNADVERCWLPWDWCDTVKQQTRNNSIVFFQPADDTIHAVRAKYDHLKTQRTQAYGNLWYEKTPLTKIEFSSFDLRNPTSEASIADWRDLVRSVPAFQQVKESQIGEMWRSVKKKRRPSNDDSTRNVRNVY